MTLQSHEPWARHPSGLMVPTSKFLLAPESPRRINAVDLFAGCGGFSLGMERSGIDVVGVLERDAAAAITYLTNLGNPRHGCAVSYTSEEYRLRFARALAKHQRRADRRGVRREVVPGDAGWIGMARANIHKDIGARGLMFGDARETSGEEILELLAHAGWRGQVDVVMGGPPCQGFSRAGRQEPGDVRNNLVLEYLRLTHELGASVFVMENVPQLYTQPKFAALWTEFIRQAHEYGFNIAANVLDAMHYGVPQRRRRLFVVGTQPGTTFRFPIPETWSFVSRLDGQRHDFDGGSEDEGDLEETEVETKTQLGLFGGAR